MTLEQLLRTGEKPSPVMTRYPDEYGGGYMATVEVIHQLHCIVSCNAGRLVDLYSLPCRICFAESAGVTVIIPPIMTHTDPKASGALISVCILFTAQPTSCLLVCCTSDHCIEMLRQNIMCHGDVTMLTYDWVEGVKDPFPNFNIPHRCRNFEKVLNWVDEHRVFAPKSEVVRLEDNVDLASPP
jgi:hypothetical protein